jgi:transposase
MRDLEPGERQMIEELYHRTPVATIKTRCQIIVLEASPMSAPQIAQVIFYSEDTVACCIHEFHQSRLERLLPSRDQRAPAQGHDGLLEAAALDHQARSQNAGLCLLELDSPLARLAYLATETGLSLDESRIRHYLHAYGYDLLRPVLTVASPDPEYESKRVKIEEVQRRAQAGEIDLYYEDEIDLALLPTITRCWCKRGHQRKIETPRKNQKRYGAGLIHWVSGKLYWWAKSSHKDHALFRAVLSQVLAPADDKGSRKIYVVVDTYRIHFAKPVLAKFSAHPKQIELVTRPSSSPQLDPARRFWKHVRRKVTHHTFFQTIDRLLDAVTGFLRDWLLVHRPSVRSPDEPRTSHQFLEIERTR